MNAVDYGSSTGAVTLFQQSVLWHKTTDVINHSHAGNAFMLGAGGIFGVYHSCGIRRDTELSCVVIVFSAYFGRLPVLFWFSVIAFASAIGHVVISTSFAFADVLSDVQVLLVSTLSWRSAY